MKKTYYRVDSRDKRDNPKYRTWICCEWVYDSWWNGYNLSGTGAFDEFTLEEAKEKIELSKKNDKEITGSQCYEYRIVEVTERVVK